MNEPVKMDDILRIWRGKGVTVKLGYTGSRRLEYQLFDGKTLVFSGNDFVPSPMHCIDDVKSVYELLGFLTVEPGDVDGGYFKDHTLPQITWTHSNKAESLRLMLYDRESKR